MTIKIKAPRAYYYDGVNECYMAIKGGTHRVVSEADWRKLMKVLRLCEEHMNGCRDFDLDLDEALDALRGEK